MPQNQLTERENSVKHTLFTLTLLITASFNGVFFILTLNIHYPLNSTNITESLHRWGTLSEYRAVA